MTDLKPYISTAATQFAPGNFVTTWNPELGRDAVGVTRAIEDPQEANPRVLVKWLHDLSQEWVRSEYLYLAKALPMSEMKQRIASAEIDPEDGTARLNLEYVLIRGFAAMGWAQPTLATHKLIETAAEACRDGK